MKPNVESSSSQARRRGWLAKNAMWLLLIVFALGAALVISSASRPKHQGGFTPTGTLAGDPLWDAAVAQAASTGKPILLDFTASWCGPCKMMKANVFPQPRVRQMLDDRFVFVEVDVSDGRSPGANLGMIYQVQAIPTYMVVDAQGKVVDSRVGYIEANTFANWLESLAPPQPSSAG